MRILIDYRPALRERTGVGDYMHNLARAYAHHCVGSGDEVAVFTSSWKDRPAASLASELGAKVIDRRIPVRVLNYLWHRVEWPPIEAVAGRVDIIHAAHPLLIPSVHAAQVVTIHDLFFLTAPHLTRGEIRRDYPELARSHARRADAIVTNSRYTAALITDTFGVPASRVHVCSPCSPQWNTLGHIPNLPRDGYVLFVGTLQVRKNVGALLDAYTRLLERRRRMPPLVLAGRYTPDAAVWLERLSRPPLLGYVRHLGYVPTADWERLYAGARLLIMPSLDEGFGIPVLEAMSAGVPVIAANRGALPEVVGDAGTLVDPDDIDAFATAIEQLITDESFALACAKRGLVRAREFSTQRTAASLCRAYETAVENRHERDAAAHVVESMADHI